MISGLNIGDYFVVVFLCGVMGTRKLAIKALDEMIKESRINDSFKLVMIYMLGLVVGMFICMGVMINNSTQIVSFIANNIHTSSNQNVTGEFLKSSAILVLVLFVFFQVFKPLQKRIEIITGEK